MRIRKLDFIRIGPFTNRTLSFDEGEFGFHLVYGPNEAGKSSSLRALTQWLFGIVGETKCRDHFVHAYKDLRVGGTVENDHGQTLTCIRRPGGQTSLRGENDRTKMDPAELSKFIGGLSREQFETQFGIDIHQLVAGGQTIASGGGEIGESLFAAGSGVANLPSIQKDLDAQCDLLFKPSTATKPMINAAIADLTAERKTVRETSVKSRDWQRRADELADHRKKKSELDDHQINLHRERERLIRVRDALPAIGEWKDKQAELEELGDAVRLRDNFTAQRVEVTAALTAARSAQKLAAEELASIVKKLESIGELPPILNHVSSVESLYKDLSLYRQWIQDHPTLSAQCQQLQSRAKDALRTLGKEPELEQANGLRISPAARIRIRELAEQRSGLLASADQAKRELDRRTSDLEKRTDEIARRSQPDDPTKLKKAIATAQKLGDIDSTIQTKSNELDESRATADGMRQRMPLWSGGLEELESLSIPSVETVQRFNQDFDRIDHAISQLSDELQKIEAEIEAADESLHTLTMDADVPTEESLTDARSRRDQRWQDILRLIEESPGTLEVAMIEFAKLVELSDEIGDRLRRETQRVSEKARLLGLLQRCRTQSEKRTAARLDWQNERESLLATWHATWQPLGITPLSPPEMNGWLAQHSELINLANQIRRRQAELDRHLSDRNEQISILQSYLDNGVKQSTLAPVLDACVHLLEVSNDSINDYRQLKSLADRLKDEKTLAEETFNQAEQAKLAWQAEWQKAMVSLDGDESLSATEAQAVLDTIDQLIADIDMVSKLTNQIDTQQQQIDGFQKRVHRLAADLKTDTQETSVEQLVADWHDQLKRAHEAQTSRNHLLSQQETVHKQRQVASATIETQLGLIEQLCGEAKCDTAERFPEIEARSDQLQKIEQSINEKVSELRGLAQGIELETFIAEALQEDADALKPRIEQLTEHLNRIDQERTELSETIGVEKKELDLIDGNDEAAAANQNAQQIVARMRSHVENYVRTKLGSAMLRTAVARYRQSNQGPVLARASELFARFTLGNFSGLDTDSNDNHDNILVGIRITGEGSGDRQLITVNEMSEGTCDQLFLALRIASLEWYLRSNPPVPFIVDDILLKFDDQRSAATLQCLGELSKQTQVIMFTHHRHLIDVASEALPPEILFIHSLDGSLDADGSLDTKKSRGTDASIAPKAKPTKPKKSKGSPQSTAQLF